MTLPDRMQYIEAVGAGAPDVLRLATTAVPRPKSDEVLIRVQAAGVNRPDGELGDAAIVVVFGSHP